MSTIQIKPGEATIVDPQRLSRLYDKLLLLKREQVTNPDRLLTVVTGVIEFRNMAISSIEPVRNKRQSQGMAFDISLRELRFAASPVKFEAATATLAAGSGAVTSQNERVADEEDRPTLEATNDSADRATEPVSEQEESIIFGFTN